MTMRERVLAAYGGRCSWCQRRDIALEIDHISGGGNRHRKTIKIPLATWLARAQKRLGYWPAGYELLCTNCHARKTKRGHAMPAADGKKNLNVAIPERLLEPLEKRAMETQYGKSKSQVMSAALEAFLQGSPELTALDTIHEHIAKTSADILGCFQAIQTLVEAQTQAQQTALHTVASAFRGIEERLDALERQQRELVAAYDRLKATQSTAKGLFARWNH